MIHLHGDGVRRCRGGQLDVVPAGALRPVLSVGGLQRQAQRGGAAGTVRYVEGDRAQERDALRSAHHQRRQHRLTCDEREPDYILVVNAGMNELGVKGKFIYYF